MPKRTRSAVPTPRAWRSPTLVLGPVSVKVGLKSLDAEEKIHATTLCPCHHLPIKQATTCRETGEVVEAIKRYQVGDTYVELDPADFKTDSDYTLYLEAAPKAVDVDPAFHGKTYLIWPEEGYGPQFDMLTDAIMKTGTALVGTCVLNGKTEAFSVYFSKQFGTLLVQKLIVGEDLARGDIALVNDAAEARARGPKHAQYVKLLTQLIGAMDAEYDPDAYTNDYRDRIKAALEAAADGMPIPKPVEKTPAAPPVDLMEALKASVAAAESRGFARARKPAAKKPAGRKTTTRKKVAR